MPNLKQAVPFLMVTDMDQSLAYYVDGLGFERKLEWMPQGRIEWCWLDRDGVALMLQVYRKELIPKEKLGHGVFICIVCEDALALYHEFIDKGVDAVEPFVGNSMWVVELKDPDGYVLNFESTTDVPEGTMYSDHR